MDKHTNEVILDGYKCRPNRLGLGTAGSHGIEIIEIIRNELWAGMTVRATFAAPGIEPVSVLAVEDRVVVPSEATTQSVMGGTITYTGELFEDGEWQVRNSISQSYYVIAVGPTAGNDAIQPTPSILDQMLASERARETAENARAKAELNRKASEQNRDAAEKNRAVSEQSRVASEQNRDAAEKNRAVSEQSRVVSEQNRDAAEKNRAVSEQSRVVSEQSRVVSEQSRESAEDSRKAAELSRKSSEDARANAEQARLDAEKARAAAERDRAAAEELRQETTHRAVQSAENAAEAANEAASRAEVALQDQEQLNQTLAAAEAARTAAETAKGKAENARTAAETAKGKAENARTAAETAKGKAENARTAAETAQEKSETARGAAEKAANDSSADAAVASAAATHAEAEADRAEAARAKAEEVVESCIPDDTAVDGKPWTSKKIVDSLCMPFEESGNPVQVYPVEGYPLGVKVSLKPVQDGSGDPSPDNIRPIIGRDGVTITHSNDVVSNDYNIDLPETVYGGTLDVGSGVVTVDRHIVTLTGDEESHIYAGMFYSSIGQQHKPKNVYKDGISSHYPFNLYKMGSIGVTSNGDSAVYKPDGDYTGDEDGLNEWKAYLAEQYATGTPVQIVYEILNPYTIQLTPQQISALSGVNTIYTEAGTLTVTGREDPRHTITELKNAIISLGGNV